MTFDAGSIEARATIDRTEFQEGLRAMRAEADAFARNPIKLRVDVDTSSVAARMAALRTEANALGPVMGKLQKQTKDFGDQSAFSFQQIFDLITVIGPALVPLAGGLLGLSSAAAGFGLEAALAFGGAKKDIAAANAEGVRWKAGLDSLGASLTRIEDTAASGMLGPFESIVNKLNAEIPTLNDFLSQTAPLVGSIGEHLVGGLIGTLNSALPLIRVAETEVDKLFARFEHWSTSPAADKFFNTLAEDIPPAVDAIGALAAMLAHLIAAAAPVGGVVLEAITDFSHAVDDIPMPVLTTLVTLFVAWRTRALAMAAANFLLAKSEAAVVAGQAAQAGVGAGSMLRAGQLGVGASMLGLRLLPIAGWALAAGVAIKTANSATKDWAYSTNGLARYAHEATSALGKVFTGHWLSAHDEFSKGEAQFTNWVHELDDVSSALDKIGVQQRELQGFRGPTMTATPDANAFNTARSKAYADSVNTVTNALAALDKQMSSLPLSQAGQSWADLQKNIQATIDPIDQFLKLGGKTEMVYRGMKIGENTMAAAMAQTNGDRAAAIGLIEGNVDAIIHNRDAINDLIVKQTRLSEIESVVSGKYGISAQQADLYTRALGLNADIVTQNSTTMRNFENLLGAVSTSFENGNDAVQGWLSSIAQLDPASTSLANKVAVLGAGLKALLGVQMEMTNVNLVAVSGTEDLANAIAQNSKSIGVNGELLGGLHKTAQGWLVTQPKLTAGSLAISQAMMQASQQAISLAQSIYQNTGNVDQAVDAYNGLRAQFVSTEIQAGKTAEQANNLANQVYGIPKDRQTLVKLLGKNDVAGAIRDLTSKLMDFGKIIALAALGATDKGANSMLKDLLIKLGLFEGTHTAYLITDYRSLGKETAYAPAAGGLVSNAPMRKIPGFAGGGLFSGVIPFGTTDTADDVLMRASKDEYVIRATQSRKHRPLLDAINKGTHGFASGGPINGYYTGGYIPPSLITDATGSGSGSGGSAATATSKIESLIKELLGLLRTGLSSLGGLAHAASNEVQGAMNGLLRALQRIRNEGYTSPKNVTAFTAETKLLVNEVKTREALLKRLEDAQQALTDVNAKILQEQQQVTSTALGAFDIGTAGGGSSAGILAALRSDLADIKKFEMLRARALAMGLDPRLIQQLTEEGVATAGKNLEAIVNAGGSYIQQLNATYSQFANEANRLGAQQAADEYGKQQAADIAAVRKYTLAAQHEQAKINATLLALKAWLQRIETTLVTAARQNA